MRQKAQKGSGDASLKHSSLKYCSITLCPHSQLSAPLIVTAHVRSSSPSFLKTRAGWLVVSAGAPSTSRLLAPPLTSRLLPPHCPPLRRPAAFLCLFLILQRRSQSSSDTAASLQISVSSFPVSPLCLRFLLPLPPRLIGLFLPRSRPRPPRLPPHFSSYRRRGAAVSSVGPRGRQSAFFVVES